MISCWYVVRWDELLGHLVLVSHSNTILFSFLSQWTNLFMCITAALIAVPLGEMTSGIAYCLANPEIMSKIFRFSICSAVGQSFIFYTIANFDPLVLSTVTTTRKIFSVLLSILLKGHSLSAVGWAGISLACGGILSELQNKKEGKPKDGKKHSS